METSKLKVSRRLSTKEGWVRLVFVAGVALVVLGTLTLIVAVALSNIVSTATTATLQLAAMAVLVVGGGTLVGAGMAFCPADESETPR